ncbi:MAG: hypothetical protein KDB14_28730 [Planctomycetales bacterium]|nr:hypothetical protein [Planctomycetales bacterium]
MATVTKQGTLTINAAFLQEIKEVNKELWGLLDGVRDTCGGRLPPLDLRSLVDDLALLRDLLAMHFSLEEACGYFEDPLDVAPHLSEQAHALRDEHIDLYVQACQLAELAEQHWQHGRRAALFDSTCLGFRNLDDHLRRHEEAERALIVGAYSEDIGVGD